MVTPRPKALAGLLPHLYTLGFGLCFIVRLTPGATRDPLAWLAWLGAWGLAVAAVEPAGRAAWSRRRWLPVVPAAAVLLSFWFSPVVHLWQLLWLGYAAALGLLVRRGWLHAARLNRSVAGEALRWVLLGLLGLWLFHPFLAPALLGGGDARGYAQGTADFIAQLRTGTFPVLAGQSEFAYTGEIHPLRTAPALYYSGGLLHVLSAGGLPAYAVQNTVLVLAGLAAAASCYLSLLHFLPRHGWTVTLLTALYLTSPGVLAPLYAGDMLPSWLTLPWLPVLFLGLARMVDTPAERAWPVLAATALAGIWLSHPPIAFWSSICALPFAFWHVARTWSGFAGLRPQLGVAALFFLLTAFVFVSVAALDLPPDVNMRAGIRAGAIEQSVTAAWSGFFRPVSRDASALLTDLQLSPALWVALALGVTGLFRPARISTRLLAAMALFLLVLLLPPLGRPLWGNAPDLVLNTTEKWPTQRFFFILSAAVPFLALPVLAEMQRKSRALVRDTGIVLVLLAGWSVAESFKFVRRGWAITLPPALSAQRFLPGNLSASRYTYEYYASLPRHFSHGPLDPAGQLRLLEPDTLDLRTAPPATGGTEHRYIRTDYGGIFEPRLKLAPGERRLLQFDFQGAQPRGVIQVLGRLVSTEHGLPESGEALAFGANPGNDRTLVVWNSGDAPDEAEIKFIGQPDSLPAVSLRSLPQEPARLPLRLHGLVPLRATVQSATPAWLETPRLLVPGYRARVNGRPVEVAASPDSLVMVPVPAGTSEVEVDYRGPLAVRLAFWLSAAAWLGLALCVWPPRGLAARLPPTLRMLDGLGRGFLVTAPLAAGVLLFAWWPASSGLPTAKPASGQTVRLTRDLPVGRPAGTVEPLFRVSHGGVEQTVLANYVDGKRLSLGFAPAGGAPVFGDPFLVNYRAHQQVDVALATDGTATIRVNHRLALTLPAR